MPSPLNLALVDNDVAMISVPVFGSAIVVPVPGMITASGGSGKMKAEGKAVCVDGDEKSVKMQGCSYMAPPFVIPGLGTATITSLAGDQKAQKTKVNNKAVLMKGTLFTMKFQVQTPAQQPTPAGPVPDPTPMYSGGKGMFMPAQTKFFAK